MSTKFGAFYDEIAEAKTAPDSPVGGDLALLMEKQRKQTLRWLKIVFWGSLALLIFQLLVGWLAAAITLLADAAHSGSDVISYGINWLVEWWKSLPGLNGKRKEVSAQSAAETVDMIDTAGCCASILTLFVATWWAASEAWDELHLPSKGSGHIGAALLLFAIFGSAVNIGMLQMRPRQRQKTEDGTSTKDKTSNAIPEIIGQPTPDSKFDLAEFDLANFDFCQPCNPTKNDTAPSSETMDSNDAAVSLHMIFHPGCACKQGATPWCPAEAPSEPEEELQPVLLKLRDLNMTAARLHLFSDMMRNVLILVVAILIQLGIVQDEKHADAVCSLVVAGLILIGSLALALRVAGRLIRCCRKKAKSDTVRTETQSEDKAQTESDPEPEPRVPVAGFATQENV